MSDIDLPEGVRLAPAAVQMANTIRAVEYPQVIQIMGDDGRILLAIHRNGTVIGTLEDASEAAAVFVKEVRRQLSLPTPAANRRIHNDPGCPMHNCQINHTEPPLGRDIMRHYDREHIAVNGPDKAPTRRRNPQWGDH